MRICHVALSCFYIDGRFYQENELVRQHIIDGHDVLVITSTEVHDAKGRIVYRSPSAYLGADGAPVIRLPYLRFIPHSLGRKLRVHPGTFEALCKFEPDVIMFHGCAGWELRTAARYVRAHPKTIFYIDSHTDRNNSARTFFAREILHKLFYRFVLHSVLPAARKLLCISTEVMDFARDIYGVPESKLEFYPLGGRPIPDDEYHTRRSACRAALRVGVDQRVFIQSGKQAASKRLLESLTAFKESGPPDSVFLIAGVLQDDILGPAEALIAADDRVRYLGWQSPEQLTDLLCAADVYVQPGTQSATMQHSLCCRCAVMLDDVPAHSVYKCNNGWYGTSRDFLRKAFASATSADLKTMSENSYRFARDKLDYSVLAKRVLK